MQEEIEMEVEPTKPQVPIQTAQQQPEQGWIKRMVTCKCSRGREIATENLTEIRAEGEVVEEPKTEEKPETGETKSCVNKLDGFLQQLTPIYIVLLYYSVFLTLFGMLAYLFILNNFKTMELLGSLLVCAQFLKFLFIMFLEDEWQDQLPYIDSTTGNSLRTFWIYLGVLTNTDILYWVRLIYYKDRRDGVVEHMEALSRVIDAFVLNFPLMIMCAYWQLQDTSKLNYPFVIVGLLNLLAIVNAFLQVNFFDGSAYLSIRWSILFITQLYAKTLLIVSAYILLENYGIEYFIVGVYFVLGVVQFVLFNDFTDSLSSDITSFIYYQVKTFFIIIFKETSFGNEALDCEAYPNIFPLQKALSNVTYSMIQAAFNLYTSINMVFVVFLFDGYHIITSDPILLITYEIGAGCLGLQLLWNIQILYLNKQFTNKSAV